MPRAPGPALYTIGHSTRTAAELIDVLAAAGVACLIDVRSIPRSRAHPQHAIDVLPATVAAAGLAYLHLPALGGRRPRSRTVDPRVNAGWRHPAFHNYADHALGRDFHAGLGRLLALAARRPCAIMCAEAVWWRCHRRIIADHALAHGRAVVHLFTVTKQEPASLTPFARIGPGKRVTYPAPP